MRFDDERANSLVGELIRCGNFIENKQHYTLDDILPLKVLVIDIAKEGKSCSPFIIYAYADLHQEAKAVVISSPHLILPLKKCVQASEK